MKKFRFWFLWFFVAVCLFFVAACSDDGGGGSSSAPPPVLTDITFYMERTKLLVDGTITLPETLTGKFSFGGDQRVTPVYSTSNSDIVAIKGGHTLKGVAVGSATITATVTVGGVVKSKTQIFEVVQENVMDSISVSMPSGADNLLVGATLTLPDTATVTYADGTTKVVAPVYSTMDTTIITIAAKVVTGVGAGDGVVSVSYTESAKTVTKTYTIKVVPPVVMSKIEITLPEGASGLTVDSTLTLPDTATVTYSNDTTKSVTPTYTLLNITFATINSKTVTGVSAGTASLKVSYTEGGTTIDKSYSIIVISKTAKTISSVSIVANPTAIKAGESVTFNITATYDDESSEQVTADVTFTPESAMKVETDGTGAKTYKGASLEADTQVSASVTYRGKTGTATFTVKKDTGDEGISGDFN